MGGRLDPKGMTAGERAELMERHGRYYQERYRPEARDAQTSEERLRLEALMGGVRAEYAERLPRIALSRCPICGTELRRAFDPHSLDGFWWAPMPLVLFEEPASCEHFCVLLGAYDLCGRAPTEVMGTNVVVPGPQVPFVVPRLLSLDSMRAVTHRVDLPQGDRAYPVAYFAEEPIASAQLHQPWGRESYQVVDADGVPQGFEIKNDRWDFVLRPWIEKGSLLWIAPGDVDLKLRGAADGPCPYQDLPGERRPQEIRNGQLGHRDPPDGEPLELFDES